MRGYKFATNEERKEALKQSKKRYLKTENGRKITLKIKKKYKNSPKGKEAQRRYAESEKGRITIKKHYTNYNLVRNYGITYEQYLERYNSQGGICPICKIFRLVLSVDHDHKTNKIRGLVCNKCNTGMGHLKDNIKNLKNAIIYLEKYT